MNHALPAKWFLVVGPLTLLYILPFWIGPIPPLTDFGGHEMMAEMWAGDAPLAERFERRSRLTPTSIAVQWAELLSPLVSAATALRVLLSLSAILGLASLYAFLHITGRSPWLLLFGFPLTWHGLVALGTINYAAAVPCVVYGYAVAIRFETEPRIATAVTLAALGVITFWIHPLAFVFLGFGVGVIGLRALALAKKGGRLRQSAVWATLLPGAAAFATWLLLREGGGGHDVPSAGAGLRFGMLRIDKRFGVYLEEGFELLHGPADLVVVIGLLLIGIWYWRSGREPDERISRSARLLADPALCLALALFLAIFLLPRTINAVFLGPRAVPLFWFVLIAAIPMRAAPTPRQLAALVVTVTSAAGLLLWATVAFSQRATTPLTEILDHVPTDVGRVACVGIEEAEPVFWRDPLDHGCPALVARRGFYSGDAFSYASYSPVKARSPGIGAPHLGEESPLWGAWDAAVVWGPLPENHQLEILATNGPWTLVAGHATRALTDRPAR